MTPVVSDRLALTPFDKSRPSLLPQAGEGTGGNANENIAAVILAAGQSRRFGGDKLLHPLTLQGVTLPLAVHSLRPWLAAFGHVTVVVAPGADALRNAVENHLSGIRWRVCAEAKHGMGHSLAAGVAANCDAAGWLVGLADMPAVPEHTIRGVQAAIASGAPLAAPFRNGRRGHPVGFASTCREALLALHGDTGARALLQHNSDIVLIAADNDGIFTDIDHPQDVNLFTQLPQENLTMQKPATTQVAIHDIIAERWSGRAYDASIPVSQEQMIALLEAARWAPSCYGDQPWRLIVWDKNTDAAAWQQAFECIVPGNQSWVADAPVLMLGIADGLFNHNGQPNRFAQYDTGAAVENLCLQAQALGLMTHQMGGFDADKARAVFGIPDQYTLMAMISVGYAADSATFSAEVRERENASRSRRALGELFFSGRWGQPAA